MKLVVTGGRMKNLPPGYVWVVGEVLDRIRLFNEIELIAHGGCDGVDVAADVWAKNKVLSVVVRPAWDSFGGAAGPMRNRELAMIAASCGWHGLVFPGGAGTKNMRLQLEHYGVPIAVIGEDWTPASEIVFARKTEEG